MFPKAESAKLLLLNEINVIISIASVYFYETFIFFK